MRHCHRRIGSGAFPGAANHRSFVGDGKGAGETPGGDAAAASRDAPHAVRHCAVRGLFEPVEPLEADAVAHSGAPPACVPPPSFRRWNPPDGRSLICRCPSFFSPVPSPLCSLSHPIPSRPVLTNPIQSNPVQVNEGIYNDLKVQIAVTQPAEKRQRLASSFDKLLVDVTRSLEPKNRDRFTQNLTAFRHDMQTRP